jgi:hypothetical protein
MPLMFLLVCFHLCCAFKIGLKGRQNPEKLSTPGFGWMDFKEETGHQVLDTISPHESKLRSSSQVTY